MKNIKQLFQEIDMFPSDGELKKLKCKLSKLCAIEESYTIYYIYAYKYALSGRVYKRGINPEYRNEMLMHIKKKHREKMGMVLTAYAEYIKYTEFHNNCIRKKERELFKKYGGDEKLLVSDENELLKFEKEINKLSDDEIINRLKDYTPKKAEKILLHTNIPQRDLKIIALLKRHHHYKCQICGTQIKKKRRNGFYIEAAHIKAKADGGNESPENILILCPNHHKEFDFGNKKIKRISEKEIELTLNDNRYTIKLNKF